MLFPKVISVTLHAVQGWGLVSAEEDKSMTTALKSLKEIAKAIHPDTTPSLACADILTHGAVVSDALAKFKASHTVGEAFDAENASCEPQQMAILLGGSTDLEAKVAAFEFEGGDSEFFTIMKPKVLQVVEDCRVDGTSASLSLETSVNLFNLHCRTLVSWYRVCVRVGRGGRECHTGRIHKECWFAQPDNCITTEPSHSFMR